MAVDSCLTMAWMTAGKEVTTISGLGDLDSPHPLQQAFAETGAAQCGYCIPGIIIAAKAIIDENPEPSEDDIRLGSERQSLPLHRLHQDLRGHRRRSRRDARRGR